MADSLIGNCGVKVVIGVDEAPEDGKQYGRENAAWTEIIEGENNPTAALLGHTGWIAGGVPSINSGDNTKFDLTSGCGWISDHSDPENPIRTFVEWTAKTAVSVPNIVADSSTGIGIDVTGEPVLTRNSIYVPIDYREQITLGTLGHAESTITLATDRIGMPAYDGALTIVDFMRFVIGVANAGGNLITANAVGNLSLDISAGAAMDAGIAARSNPASPHILASLASVNFPFFRILRSITNTDGVFASPAGTVTTIDPNNMDDGSGAVVAVSPQQWTIQVVYWIPASGFGLVAYGQKTYISLAAALDDFNDGAVGYDERLQIRGTLQRAYLFVKNGATDLTDPAEALIREAPKFRVGPLGIS